MKRAAMKQLALDALYYRSLGEQDSCLVRNADAEMLAKCLPEAISVIEEVLMEEVLPVYIPPEEVELFGVRVLQTPPGAPEFLGLTNLLGAYLLLGSREGEDPTIPFLRRMSKPMLLEVISAICAYFRKSDRGGGYVNEIAPGDALKEFLKTLSRDEREDVRKMAMRTLELID